MTHDVFISHSSADAPVALAVVNALESRGIRCWIAPRDIQGGQIWAEAIMHGIAGARAMVVIFSSSANRSTHVLTEVDTAVRQGCIVVPFRIEAVEPEGALAYHLRTRHWLDALTPALATHIQLLVDTLGRLLEVAPGPKPADSQPWLNTMPSSGPAPSPPPPTPPPPPPPPGPPTPRRGDATSFWRRPAVRLGVVVVALVTVGTLLLWMDRQRGTFLVRDASVSGDPVTLPVRVTGMRFFEASAQVPVVNDRVYEEEFAAGSARYLYVQLDLEHGRPTREVRLPISCTITDQLGAVLTTITASGRLQPDWEGSHWASGWGSAGAGTWREGRYTAACSYGGEEIATGRFEVVGGVSSSPGAPEVRDDERVDARIPELGGRVGALRFFPDYEGPITPKPERKYTSSFASREMLFLGIELELQYPAPGRRVSLQATCQIISPDDSVFGEVGVAIEPEPEWTGSFSAASFGWNEAGRWPAGRYAVACRINGQLVAREDLIIR